MKHDVKIRRSGFERAVNMVCRSVCQWRRGRSARLCLAGIALRQNRHLLDDIGLESIDDAGRREPARGNERHHFWML